MGCQFDKWTILKFFELGFSIACLVTKTVTDWESKRLFLYLEKISREWSLLNSITWDRVGSAVADATYGGYVIITGALLIGRMIGEIPTEKRIFEFILLGVGAILFIAMGSLEFAALDQVPTNLLDNAAICGCLSLVTAFLFLMDMGGPRGKPPPKENMEMEIVSSPYQHHRQQMHAVEQPVHKNETRRQEEKPKTKKESKKNAEKGQKNGDGKVVQANGYKKMKDQQNDGTKRYGIYGKDFDDYAADEVDDASRPQTHSPVWSNVRRGQYDIVTPTFVHPYPDIDYEDRPPSGPGDPGFVQYAAQKWEQHAQAQKTPRPSPTQV